jgi:hypothetical protein
MHQPCEGWVAELGCNERRSQGDGHSERFSAWRRFGSTESVRKLFPL